MTFVRIFLLLLISLRLLGGDSGVLQVVAWTGMLVSRAPEQGIAAAVESTFDGEHPCPLCVAIKKSESKEPDETPLTENILAKLKLKDVTGFSNTIVPSPLGLETAGLSKPVGWSADFTGVKPHAPPVPPPREV
jgi:hypothetical protein